MQLQTAAATKSIQTPFREIVYHFLFAVSSCMRKTPTKCDAACGLESQQGQKVGTEQCENPDQDGDEFEHGDSPLPIS